MRNDKNICFIGILSRQFLYNKANTIETALSVFKKRLCFWQTCFDNIENNFLL